MVPERICPLPSSMELVSQASRSSGTKCGDMAGVRLLPRLKPSRQACTCVRTASASTP
ncbi:hypothetical protein JaAD80_28460 [Janthinobacterium sp. AD80]|nr:hypothetical protein JaAD80_28460 [Janthinobacterium sp. AD80]